MFDKKLPIEARGVRRIYLMSPVLFQGIYWLCGQLMLKFFTHLIIFGQDNLARVIHERDKRKTGVIFALNHTHELDFSFPLVGVSPASPLFPIFYVVHNRKMYAANATLGWRRYLYAIPTLLASLGAHAYVPNQKNYAKALVYHEQLLRLRKSVCIFPEGKIPEDATHQKAHGGLGYLVAATRAPVVPVTVSGVRDMTIRAFLTRQRTVRIHYGTPMYAHELINNSLPLPERYQQASQKVMGSIHGAVATNRTS